MSVKNFFKNFISGAVEGVIVGSDAQNVRNVDDYKIDGSNITSGDFVDHAGNECTEFFGGVINKATGEKIS